MKKIDLKNIERKRLRRPWFIIFSILILVVAAQLVVTNILAVGGQELSTLEGKALQISRENQILRENLSNKTSLSHISQKSEELGLTTPGQVVYVEAAQPVASLLP